MKILSLNNRLFVPVSLMLAWTFASSGNAGGVAPGQGSKSSLPQIVGPKRTVSVFSFDIKIGISSGGPDLTIGAGGGNVSGGGAATPVTIAIPNAVEFGAGLGDIMASALTESKAFVVLDPPAATTGTIGVGAPEVNPAGDAPLPQYLLRAVLTEISCNLKGGGINISVLGLGQKSFENKVTLDVRLVDPTTNVILDTVKATGKKTSKSAVWGANKDKLDSSGWPIGKVYDLSFSDFESSPLAEATRIAIEDAVKKLIDKANKRPWEAMVARIMEEETGQELYLNLDEDCGLKVGEKLELLMQGEPILDPVSKRVTGRTRAKPLGFVEVFQVDAESVICKPLDSLKESPIQAERPLIVRLVKRA